MPKGRSDKQTVKILFIRDFLLSNTNENHYVTSKDIIEHLEKEEIRADRKTVFSDIARLEDYYHMEIEHAGKKGYRVINHVFEPRELRLMIDAVHSARFISETEATKLTSKIKNLADIYTQKKLDRKAFVSERISNMKESVVSRTDIIYDAINDLDAQISFKYVHYNPSLRGDRKRYSRNGEPYKVSPFALYWNNGNYYLYAYLSDKEQMRFFRIDRMESIKIESEKRVGHDAFDADTLRNQNKAKVFDMYKGEAVTVTLRGDKKIADAVIDAFGQKTMIMPFDEDHFTANVFVEVSPTFFAWLANFGDKIEITNPPSIRNQMKKYIESIFSIYSK